MDDYVSRTEALAKCHAVTATRDNGVGTIGLTYADLKELPAADVRENVRGAWEWDKREGVYLCPFCKEEMHDSFRRDGSFSMAEFCWHCGAVMKGNSCETEVS